MSNDREVQELLQVVRERALLNLLSNPLGQPCSTKAQRKAEVRSKLHEEKHRSSQENSETSQDVSSWFGRSGVAVCLMHLDTQFWGP